MNKKLTMTDLITVTHEMIMNERFNMIDLLVVCFKVIPMTQNTDIKTKRDSLMFSQFLCSTC